MANRLFPRRQTSNASRRICLNKRLSMLSYQPMNTSHKQVNSTCPPRKLRRWSAYLWREWARPMLTCLLVVCAFRSAIADWNDVPTGSMKPTILEGDRVFVNKLAFDLKVPFTTWRLATWAEPKRGDIVVFFSPYDGIRLVKRVIGLPGDQIEMRDNKLFVNSAPVNYDALDSTVAQSVAADDRSLHTFVKEKLGEHSHAMMLTPQLGSLRSFG